MASLIWRTSQKRKIKTSTSVGTDLYPHMPIPLRAIYCNDFGLMGGKVHKMGDSLPWMPINRPAKFDAASFILGGEIRNRTNKQTNT